MVQRTKKQCSIDGCESTVYRVEWCNKHYLRKKRYGDPLAGKGYVMEGTPEERFWAKVRKSPGCWEWQGFRNQEGYGRVRSQGKYWIAHRLSWTLTKGEIPHDVVIDHICHNPSCVNPEHLRPATHKQNMENLNPLIWGSRDLPRGVSQDKRDGRFYVRVKHRGKVYTAGGFDCVKKADEAAIELRREVFTHNNADWTPAKVVEDDR